MSTDIGKAISIAMGIAIGIPIGIAIDIAIGIAIGIVMVLHKAKNYFSEVIIVFQKIHSLRGLLLTRV